MGIANSAGTSRRAMLAVPILGAFGVTAGAIEVLPIDTLDERIKTAGLAYDHRPPADTLAVVLPLARGAVLGARQTRSAGRRSAYTRLAARGHLLAGQAFTHTGRTERARQALFAAGQEAQAIGDIHTRAHVLALSARIADKAGHRKAAVELARQGRRVAPRNSPMEAMLAIKYEAGALSSTYRTSEIAVAIRAGDRAFARSGEQRDPPRGWSFLDDGIHPGDLALSAAGALAAAREPVGEWLEVAQADADSSGAHAMRAAVRIVSARDAVNRRDFDAASQALNEAVTICPDARTWLAREVLEVAGLIRAGGGGAVDAAVTAQGWLGLPRRPGDSTQI